jgi:hypothetical protein
MRNPNAGFRFARSCEIEGKRSRKAPKTVNLRLVAEPIYPKFLKIVRGEEK